MAKRLAIPARSRTDGDVWTTVTGTTIAAILVRVWFPRAWGELYAAASVFYEGDARAYLDYAAHLVTGIPFDNGVPFHPPGWPFVLSIVFRLAGFDPIDGTPVGQPVIKGFVAVLSGLTVGMTTLVTSRLAGRGAMLAVAAIGTFSFPHIVQGSVANADALYGLLVAATMLLACRWYSAGHSPRQAAVLGALAGFATLVRPEFVVCAVLLAIGQARRASEQPSGLEPATRRPKAGTTTPRRTFVVPGLGRLITSSIPKAGADERRAGVARGTLAYVGAFLLTLTPTTIWHWQSISAFNETRGARLPGPLPRFAPVTSYGAFNFANANHERSSGGFNFDAPALRPQTREEEKQFDEGFLDLSLPSVYNVYVNGYSIGLQWTLRHPGDALALIGRKAFITSGVFAHGYLQTNVGAGVEGVRRPVDLADPSSRWLWPVHVALVLAGACFLAVPGLKAGTTTAAGWIVFSPLASFAASALLFYGYVRLGAAYLPAFWLLQGIAIASIAARLPMPSFLRLHAGRFVAAVMAILLIVEAIGMTVGHRVALEGSTTPDGGIVQDAAVTIKAVSSR